MGPFSSKRRPPDINMTTTVQTDTFASFGLSEPTLRGVAKKGYQHPTAVQRETIPLARAGKDLVVQSRTGTGKTAAFGIPLVEGVEAAREEVQGLVLTPTRELAVQVHAELRSLGSEKGVKVQAIYGGDSMAAQIDGIREGAHLVVGTPGRVLDLLRRSKLRLDALRWLVLDEADKMLDMGFAQEMSDIMAFVPEKRQTLLFSATVPMGIRGLIYTYLEDPEWVLLSEDFAYVKEVRHTYIMAPAMQKDLVLYRLIEYDDPTSSMIFCNTKSEVRSVSTFLAKQGLPVAMISSDLTQARREQVMAGFRTGRIRHLVATDVAARGIDVIDLSHVFIYSTPDSPENYIHRAGRTGRIGRGGDVVSLVGALDLVSFNRLANRYHLELTERPAPTEEEIRERRRERRLAGILEDLSERSEALSPEHEEIADALLGHSEARRLVGHLVARHFERQTEAKVSEDAGSGPEARGDDASRAEPAHRRSRRRRSRSRGGRAQS